MNTNRIVLGDIEEVTEKVKHEEHTILFGEDVITLSLSLKSQEVIPHKKKVILVKFPENSYVELAKLNSFKDLIKIYHEILFFNPDTSKYVLKERSYFTSKYFVNVDSVSKYNSDLKTHESVKSLRKKLLK